MDPIYFIVGILTLSLFISIRNSLKTKKRLTESGYKINRNFKGHYRLYIALLTTIVFTIIECLYPVLESILRLDKTILNFEESLGVNWITTRYNGLFTDLMLLIVGLYACFEMPILTKKMFIKRS